MVVFAMWGNAAEVVSMKLCDDRDYDASLKQCAPGKALEGPGIVMAPEAGKAMNFLTAVKTDKPEEIYHVWIYSGKASGLQGLKVVVYDSTTKTLREAGQEDLDWLKERNIEGARLVVKLSVMPSAGYRTRSQKTLGLGAAGPWKVQVYDSMNLTTIGEMTFAVTPADKRISDE